MRVSLHPHPDTPAKAVTAIEVEIAREDGLLRLTYRASGRMSDLLVPTPAEFERADELWKETCFEAFVRGPRGDEYCEFNLAPSTRWAAYAFESYRSGMRNYEVAPLYLETNTGDDWFELRTAVAPGAEWPWCIALSAVIEETDGTKSYWALAHPRGKPDFHHADAFELDMQSYLSADECAALEKSIVVDAARLAELINAPQELRLTSDLTGRYSVTVEWHEQDDGDDVSEYRYFFWILEDGEFRGASEAGLSYRDAFLKGFFQTITHVMAMATLGNPKPGDFDRAELFRRQEALLRVLNGAWADAVATQHAYLLKK